MNKRIINHQSSLEFKWESPLYYKRAFLIPKKTLEGWELNGNEGYVHGMNRNLTATGGKLAVFQVSVKGVKSGYMVFDGYDELNGFFDVKYL